MRPEPTTAITASCSRARRIVLAAACLLLATPAMQSQDTKYPAQDNLIPLPACFNDAVLQIGYTACTPADLKAWHDDIFHWRDETRIRMGYDDVQYRRPDLRWAQSSFMQPQMMVEERFFYDPATRQYTVDRYLDDLAKRFGGIDSVLIWQSYPNIGIDSRSQYDLIRALPGGIPALRQVVDQFHKRGVRVLFPVMVWDQGTHSEGVPNWESTAKLLAEIGADGVNGDTLGGFPRAFREASDKTGHPLVLEPEGYPRSQEMLAYNNMSWGYWRFPFTVLTSTAKLIEPRHMVNISDRWARSKTDDLQFAFFNGVGLETWENVWGIWNGITPRGAESIRRVAAVDRAVAPFLTSKDWEPLTPTLQFGVFASRWPVAQEEVFTVVNRNEYDVTGPQLELPATPGLRFYDLWHGTELTPTIRNGKASLSFAIEGHGFGAIIATPDLKNPAILALMEKSKHWSEAPLASFSDDWKALPQSIVAIPTTPVPTASPAGMIKIPAADFLFRVDGVEIEGNNWSGQDVQYPWEDSPRRHHLHQIAIPSFWIDKYPVTNAAFKKFVDATHYHPADDYNFLKDWKNGTYPTGWDNKPVTWVSQEDARAYAAWAGKRLPHEWEWQYAAQGSDNRVYPWGDTWNDNAVPKPNTARDLTSPDNVDAHPSGASSFGVMDLVGNVWQWTDEYQDPHTRTAILRGSSYYQPQTSIWYFPRAARNTEHGRYLLMAPAKDRAGTLGFRCVVDAP
jgi:formylglycine-generating enzyme required for sulfatase activity